MYLLMCLAHVYSFHGLFLVLCLRLTFFQVLVLGNKRDLPSALDEKQLIEKMWVLTVWGDSYLVYLIFLRLVSRQIRLLAMLMFKKLLMLYDVKSGNEPLTVIIAYWYPLRSSHICSVDVFNSEVSYMKFGLYGSILYLFLLLILL